MKACRSQIPCINANYIVVFFIGRKRNDGIALKDSVFRIPAYYQPEVVFEIDYASCGYHPACRVYPHRDKSWILVCDKTVFIFIAVLSTLLSAAIIASNILIVVVISRTKTLRKPQEYFKISLATAGK